ncbi:MAG TPA: hypothetical protein VJ898_09120 [Natrialbaceae archaeon]|nr:hypothetical protein [Natrialbaceae archaeon]
MVAAEGDSDSTGTGDAWVYESLVGVLPGVTASSRVAVAIQFAGFEAVVLVLGLFYGRPLATLAGSVAVGVAAAGSALMLRLGERIRSLSTPEAYPRFLFGSQIEVVLGVFAFVAVVTHLFVYDPRVSDESLLTTLLGDRPPVPAVYIALLIVWDLTYRIGTGWWAAVVACWRSYRFEFDPATAAALRRIDGLNALFGVLQLALVPFVWDRPILRFAVVGHVVAVLVVTGTSVWLLGRRDRPSVSVTGDREG